VSGFREVLDNVNAYSGGDDGFVDLDIPETGAASVKYPSDGLLDLDPVTGQIAYPDDGLTNTPVAESSPPYSFPHLRGAARSIEDSLSRVSFVPGSAGEMSASIAYIRYWTRKGSQQKVSVGMNPQEGAPTDPQETLAQSVNNLSAQPFATPLQQPSSRLTLAVPTNTSYQSRPRQPVVVSQPGLSSPRFGQIFSANPGSSRSWDSVSAAPAPDGAVWQFLFNPEELQLSSGPDYNRAETWGVADPANSGQPLSWRSNKNRKLTFGKVLLHGYTFGRRVDSLERGLQQLFQARDGENGADGPPVLEFVWGQRVFGPCVIQNIQVREKAWDKGLLVNAEVSFELEQVPEWTINDGFVDVLRPGRQSTINDPSAVSEAYRSTSAEQEPPANRPGGGSEKPQSSITIQSCRAVQSDINYINKYIGTVNNNLEGRVSISANPLTFGLRTVTSTFESNLSKYKPILQKYSSSSVYGSRVNQSLKSESNCTDTSGLEYTWRNSNASTSSKDKFSNQQLVKCSKIILSVIEKYFNDTGCKKLSAPSGRQIGPGIF
jgi:hypothetical protein